VYRKGTDNTNADSTSCNPVSPVAITSLQSAVTTEIQVTSSPAEDSEIKEIHNGLSSSSKLAITDRTQPLLNRLLQIW